MPEITVVMLHSVQPLLFQVASSGISKPQICRVKSDQGMKRKQYKANGSCKQAPLGHLWQNSAEVNVHAMTLLGHHWLLELSVSGTLTLCSKSNMYCNCVES